jgi:hypothetical protein
MNINDFRFTPVDVEPFYEMPELTRVNTGIDDFDVKEFRFYLSDKVDDDANNLYQGARLLRRRFGLNKEEAMEQFKNWLKAEDSKYDLS